MTFGVERAPVRADGDLRKHLLQGRELRRRRQLGPHAAVGQRAVALDRERGVPATRGLADDQRRAIGGDDRAVGKHQLLGGHRRGAVGVHAHQRRQLRIGERHQVKAEATDPRASLAVDDHVVERAVGERAEVGVHAHVPAGLAPKDELILHRDDQKRAVRQPPEPRRLLLDLEHDFLAAVGADRVDRLAIEVRHPPPAVPPPRALEERAALEQRGQRPFAHAGHDMRSAGHA